MSLSIQNLDLVIEIITKNIKAYAMVVFQGGLFLYLVGKSFSNKSIPPTKI